MSRTVLLLLTALTLTAHARVNDGCSPKSDGASKGVNAAGTFCSLDVTKVYYPLAERVGFVSGDRMEIYVNKHPEVQRLMFRVLDQYGAIKKYVSRKDGKSRYAAATWWVSTGRDLDFKVCSDSGYMTIKHTTEVQNANIEIDQLYPLYESRAYGDDLESADANGADMKYAIEYDPVNAPGEFLHAALSSNQHFLGHTHSGGCVRSYEVNQKKLFDYAFEILNLGDPNSTVTVTILNQAPDEGSGFPYLKALEAALSQQRPDQPEDSLILKNFCFFSPKLPIEKQKELQAAYCAGLRTYNEERNIPKSAAYNHSARLLTKQCPEDVAYVDSSGNYVREWRGSPLTNKEAWNLKCYQKGHLDLKKCKEPNGSAQDTTRDNFSLDNFNPFNGEKDNDTFLERLLKKKKRNKPPHWEERRRDSSVY